MTNFYVVTDKRQPVPSYPDFGGQGGCSEVDGNQPVVCLFSDMGVAQAFADYLNEPVDGQYEVRPAQLIVS